VSTRKKHRRGAAATPLPPAPAGSPWPALVAALLLTPFFLLLSYLDWGALFRAGGASELERFAEWQWGTQALVLTVLTGALGMVGRRWKLGKKPVFSILLALHALVVVPLIVLISRPLGSAISADDARLSLAMLSLSILHAIVAVNLAGPGPRGAA
jgi:hypothetical protein